MELGSRIGMTSDRDLARSEICATWHRFFSNAGHRGQASTRLVSDHDGLLFTVSAIVPFIGRLFDEKDKGRYSCVQGCMRTKGRSTDLDSIGPKPNSLAYFEMLGALRLQDSDRPTSIQMVWSLLAHEFSLDPRRLSVSVSVADKAAFRSWRDLTPLTAEQISILSTADEMWEMGAKGPCGPRSKIYWRLPNGERLEIGDLVFASYLRDEHGSLTANPLPFVDIGMGLERVLLATGDRTDVFETEALRPLVDLAQSLVRTGSTPAEGTRLRVLAEHARTTAALVTDGLDPGPNGPGHVLRRIIRRAIRQLDDPTASASVFCDLVQLAAIHLPEENLRVRSPSETIGVVQAEATRYALTLGRGLDRLENHLSRSAHVSGLDAFEMHGTFGLSIEVIERIASQREATVDRRGFDELMEQDRQNSRSSTHSR